MPTVKIRRRPRLARRDRINREHYDYAIDKAAALKQNEPLVVDEQPIHIGQQSNHLRF